MARDTVTIVPFLDGTKASRQQNSTTTDDNIVVPQTALRTNGLPVEADNPLPTFQAGFSFKNSASGTMGNTLPATIIVPFDATRKWLMITNRTTGSETQDIGSSNVVVGSGIPLGPGGGFLFQGGPAVGPIYGISSVGGSPFSYVEA